MKREELEELFLDYLEGTLDDTQREAVEGALAADSELQARLNRYREVLAHERSRAAVMAEPSPDFVAKVMRRVERRDGFLKRLFMLLAVNRRLAGSLIATTAVAVLVVRLAENTPWSAVSFEGSPEMERLATRRPAGGPIVPAPLNPGSSVSLRGADVSGSPAPERTDARRRSTTLDVTMRGVDTATVGSNVDIYLERKRGAQSTISRVAEQAKVLSIEGQNEESAQVTVEMNVQDITAVEQQKSEGRLHIVGPPAIARESHKATTPSMKPQLMNEVELDSVDSVSPYPSSVGGALRWNPSQMPSPGYERYRGMANSHPILASQEAFSTFSIDVDTASYTNSRRFIEQGQLPPRDAVRTEEFINYFDYAYPVQNERPFTLSYEIAPSPFNPGKTLLKLGIKARDIVAERKPWNLVFLIDTSGSMSDANKLPLVKRALQVLVDKMRPEDRVAIVTYSGSTEIKLASTAGIEKSRIGGVIEGLIAEGGTNGSGGIQMAYAVAGANKMPGVNRVVLVTDGDFNLGVTSHDDLVRLIEQQRQSGIALTTIGVGVGNINDALLEQLADKGDGNYFYLDSFREARRIFEEKIAGTIETVAKDVKLQMEFNPQNVTQYKLIGYENRTLAKQDFNNDRVDAGEIGLGHTVTAMYELVLTGSSGVGSLGHASRYQQAPAAQPIQTTGKFDGELGFLKIRFKAPEGSSSELLEFPVAMSDIRKDFEATTADFKFAAAIAGFGQLLRGAPSDGVGIEQLIALAEQGVGADTRGERREAIDLMRSAKLLLGHSAVVEPIEPRYEGEAAR